MTDTPTPPRGLGPAGRALWRSVHAVFELEAHERTVLREAARTCDTIAALQRVADQEGPTIDSPQGVRVHPALAELRQQRLALARLLASLRIPTDSEGRVQRRTGVRGVYGLGDAS